MKTTVYTYMLSSCIALAMPSLAFADFEVDFSVLFAAGPLDEKVCKPLRAKKVNTKVKAAGLVHWLGLCQPKFLTHYFNSNGWIPNENATQFQNSYDKSFVLNFAEARTNIFYYTLLSRTGIDTPTLVRDFAAEFPVIARKEGDKAIVWDGFPTEVPLLEVENSPAALERFCSIYSVPEGYIPITPSPSDYAPATCSAPDVDGSAAKIEDLSPSGKEWADKANAKCRRNRRAALLSGAITQEEFFTFENENSNVAFSNPADPTSSVLGTEPCEVAAKSRSIILEVPGYGKIDVSQGIEAEQQRETNKRPNLPQTF